MKVGDLFRLDSKSTWVNQGYAGKPGLILYARDRRYSPNDDEDNPAWIVLTGEEKFVVYESEMEVIS